MSRSVVSWIALLGLLLVWGCDSDPLKSGLVEGTYRAVAANGRSLPAFINPDGSTGSGRQLNQASLMLQPSDVLQLIVTTRVVDASENPTAAEEDTLHAHYRVEGSRLVLSPRGGHPLRLGEQADIRSGGALVLTLQMPLPPSQGFGTYPVELLFRR